ncbi:MAG: deoxyguanosinetriphosphate triphosphohydrolase [Eubacterium sp.]|nr:deoxyguanosinetriphosphate triphosphohydrolase [Eubacterium sp.]SEG25627.1 dGTPase [Eubacterium ruminantium]
MTIREDLEKREHKIFSPFAAFSDESKGRDRYEEQCDVRTVYQRDRDRIIHSKSFRRLKHKTQVFLSPYGDHYRTRLTHTLEVAQIARTISRSLRLNEDLTEAIALGHDLGHTPFGHAGERALTEVLGRPFRHNEQSVRVVERLENDGKGLNLTWEVRDGMLNHKTSLMPATLEGRIVRLSDKVAYISHDIDDGIRAGLMDEESIPSECADVLGHSTRDRIDNLIHDIIYNSKDSADVTMSKDFEDALYNLRQFMFANLYTNPKAKSEEVKAAGIIEALFKHYMSCPEEMSEEFLLMIENGESQDTVVCDYIAGMTDNYAIMKFKEFYIPHSWSIL